MTRANGTRAVAIVTVALALACALAVGARAASAAVRPTVVVGTGWRAVSTTLAARSHVRLSCPAGWHGVDMDAATVGPFALAHGVWKDGGEAMQWRAHGAPVAFGRPSQSAGLSSVAFKSYARRAAVEVICER